jgi:hypothetical protein
MDDANASSGRRDEPAADVRFPAVGGRSLVGVAMALPGDLPAGLTLAIVAFRRWHQDRVDRWIARAVAAGIPPTIRGATELMPVAVVEIPVLSTAWRPGRRIIDGGMTADIADPDVLARTITVYTNVGAFQRSLGIPDGDDVHAFVTRRDGTILAHGRGDPTDAEWGAVAAALSISGR